jgi:hypothetical protein
VSLPGKKWDNLCEKDKFLYRESIRLLKNFECPICHEIMTKRYIICSNGHSVCNSCLDIQIKNMDMACCLCRRPFVNLNGILLREEEDCISTFLSWIFSLSTFSYPSWVDVFIQKEELKKTNTTTSKPFSQLSQKWYVGQIQSMDVESETFQISILGFSQLFYKHIFSDDIEPLFTHTENWRMFHRLPIGSMVDVLLSDNTSSPSSKKWVEGTVVFTDRKSERIFVVYENAFQENEIDVQPFSFKNYDCPLAPYRTFTSIFYVNEEEEEETESVHSIHSIESSTSSPMYVVDA